MFPYSSCEGTVITSADCPPVITHSHYEGLTLSFIGLKTLIARALAASCSRAGAEVAFFMRKGADVLSKWVGESERQLRLLFAEAQKREPAIIFFDEIDGTALGVSQIQAHRLMPLFDVHGRR
jgi:hypothetical protein